MPTGQMDQVVNRFTQAPLSPAFPGMTRTQPVNLVPSVTLSKGTILGQITSAANDVQTLTVGGSPTNGSFVTTAIHPISGATVTFSLAWNSSVAATQTAVNTAFGPNICTVSGAGALPTNTQAFTFGGAAGNMPVPLMTATTTGLSGGTPTTTYAHTTVGATAATYKAYASGNSDGSQTARGILMYDVASDAAGNITYGTASTGGPWGEKYPSVPMYVQGTFDTSQLTGLDSNAVTNMGGHLASGTVTAGILVLG